jgi:hypothetical protein
MLSKGSRKNYDLDQFRKIFEWEKGGESPIMNHEPTLEDGGDHRSQGAERFLGPSLPF